MQREITAAIKYFQTEAVEIFNSVPPYKLRVVFPWLFGSLFGRLEERKNPCLLSRLHVSLVRVCLLTPYPIFTNPVPCARQKKILNISAAVQQLLLIPRGERRQN